MTDHLNPNLITNLVYQARDVVVYSTEGGYVYRKLGDIVTRPLNQFWFDQLGYAKKENKSGKTPME